MENMSKIEELIQQYCPDGVEYKKIGSFTRVLRGKRLTKSQLSNSYSYPVYHGGLEPLGFYSHKNRDSDTVMIINVGASAGTVGYSDKEFWSSDGCYCIEHSEQILNKFLFAVLSMNQQYLVSKVRHAGIPTLDAAIIEGLEVPVPPMEVQREIVHILDSFTFYTSELSAELSARREQYNYYRDILLKKNAVKVLLKSIAIISNEKVMCAELDSDNFVGVDNLLQGKQGKKKAQYIPKEGTANKYRKGDVLIGNIRPYLQKIWFADNDGGASPDVIVIHPLSNLVNPKYLYHCLASDEFFIYDMNHSKGAKMPRGDKSAILNYELSLPSIETQNDIVNILNSFEIISNDIIKGLPAEIEARQKQYEYYRDKLLDFRRINNDGGL